MSTTGPAATTDQQRLDAAVAELKTLIDKWQAKLTAPPPPPPAPLDLTGLDAIVSSAQTLDGVIDPTGTTTVSPGGTPAPAVVLDANGNIDTPPAA